MKEIFGTEERRDCLETDQKRETKRESPRERKNGKDRTGKRKTEKEIDERQERKR